MGRSAALKALAIFYLAGSVLCVGGALRPMSVDTPATLLLTLAAVGAGGACVLMLLRDRAPGWLVHVGLVLLSVGVAVLAWRSATAVGVVVLGPLLFSLGLYTGHFLSRGAARLHVAFACAGSSVGALFSVAPAIPLQPWVVNVVAALLVTEVQARLAGSLHRAALTDPLTGLPNRRAWLDATDRAVAVARRHGRDGPAVVIIDLDGFKKVNDEHGHAGGDRLLRELAAAWSSRLRRSDVLARYGGDEFALLLPDGSGAEALLDRMQASHEARWTAGIGRWRSGDTTGELLLRADDDLYDHKHRRPRMSLAPRTDRAPEDELREAR